MPLNFPFSLMSLKSASVIKRLSFAEDVIPVDFGRFDSDVSQKRFPDLNRSCSRENAGVLSPRTRHWSSQALEPTRCQCIWVWGFNVYTLSLTWSSLGNSTISLHTSLLVRSRLILSSLSVRGITVLNVSEPKLLRASTFLKFLSRNVRTTASVNGEDV